MTAQHNANIAVITHFASFVAHYVDHVVRKIVMSLVLINVTDVPSSVVTFVPSMVDFSDCDSYRINFQDK